MFAKNNPKWDLPNVTWDILIGSDRITPDLFFEWIERMKIEVLFFNEQRNFEIIALTKKKYPRTLLGAYVDYYTEDLLQAFNLVDFVVCNTRRHYEAMEKHPQRFYLRWGTDVGLFKPTEEKDLNNEVTFFHSVGMAPRKGTDILLDAYIHGKLYEKSKLIIHTQIPLETVTNYSTEKLKPYPNIIVIEKTVPAPGLYSLGDVYVYPTRLDGLGLTMYESLACGLPVITTNAPPMNEIIDDNVGRLVDVERFYCRSDGYYWPLAKCDEESLIEAMNYYIENPKAILMQRREARKRAETLYDWSKQTSEVNRVFESAKLLPYNEELVNRYLPAPTQNVVKRIIKSIMRELRS